MKLEFYEWANFWFENAPADIADVGRVLLIGDSITGGYRVPTQKLLAAKNLVADMAIGSRGADNPALYAELEYIAGPTVNYKYKAIHFNNGIHAGHLEVNEYKSGMRRCIETLKRLQPDAKMILVTSTAFSAPEKNKYIEERNAVVLDLAKEYSYAVNDLFSVVTLKPEYPQPDGVHFTAPGYEALGEAVSNKITSVLGEEAGDAGTRGTRSL
jgi:acyl-CoA thioesterase-1